MINSDKILNYLKQVESLEFIPVSIKTWEDIQHEGLDEEFSSHKDNFKEAKLIILDEDKKGLMLLKEETIELFNQFDIALKENYSMKYIDFVDYNSGHVKIIKISKK